MRGTYRTKHTKAILKIQIGIYYIIIICIDTYYLNHDETNRKLIEAQQLR